MSNKTLGNKPDLWLVILIIASVILGIAVVLAAQITLRGEGADLNQEELDHALLSFRMRGGGTIYTGTYQLRSLDDGETWYAVDYVDEIGVVLGTAEEIYPGLLAFIEASHNVLQYPVDNRVIPKEEADQTEEEKVLLQAREDTWERLEELNKKE